ncbi:MAG: manganese efflux pump [Clostridia bacterium]
MTLYVFLTAIAVSIDSLIAGFGLSLRQKRNIWLPLIVAIVTFILCSISFFLGETLSNIASENLVNIIGAGMLIVCGLKNLFGSSNSENISNFLQAICVGIAVGFDASIAEISLVLLGYTSFAIPIFFALLHFFTVYAGSVLSSIVKIKNTNVFSCVTLISLGLFKLVA